MRACGRLPTPTSPRCRRRPRAPRALRAMSLAFLLSSVAGHARSYDGGSATTWAALPIFSARGTRLSASNVSAVQLVERLKLVGADPQDDEDLRARKTLLVLISLLILPVAGLWAALY